MWRWRTESRRRSNGIARQAPREVGGMDDDRFDRWIRFLEGQGSRRGVVGIVAAGLMALPLREASSRRRRGKAERRGGGTGQAAARQNADCAARCKELFPPGKARGQCISDGARGRGPCAKPICDVRCANDRACCDEPGFGCCDDTCTRLDDDGECPPPVCTAPSSCTDDAQCCGIDRCSCGDPHVCVQFKSLGTGACCKSDDECIQQCVTSNGSPFGVCCDPAFPATCVCGNCGPDAPQ